MSTHGKNGYRSFPTCISKQTDLGQLSTTHFHFVHETSYPSIQFIVMSLLSLPSAALEPPPSTGPPPRIAFNDYRHDINLTLSDPTRMYIPGDTIKGSVTFDKNIVRIHFIFEGQAIVECGEHGSKSSLYDSISFVHETMQQSIAGGTTKMDWSFCIPKKTWNFHRYSNFWNRKWKMAG